MPLSEYYSLAAPKVLSKLIIENGTYDNHVVYLYLMVWVILLEIGIENQEKDFIVD